MVKGKNNIKNTKRNKKAKEESKDNAIVTAGNSHVRDKDNDKINDDSLYNNLDFHKPVLIDEVVDVLADCNLVVDCTFGAGGYSLGLLRANNNLKVIAIDRDKEAIERGKKLISKEGLEDRLTLLHGRFGDIDKLLGDIGILQVDGIVMDLGVSSPQLDDAERGFSFKHDGPLDMCMGLCEFNAAHVVNNFSEEDIANIIYKYGDERKSRRIAKKIVEKRKDKPFETTKELADVVRAVVGFERRGFDPATRTFQALRIFVNKEMEELEKVLLKSLSFLRAGGKLVCVTFHSGEDRIVKHFIKEYSGQNAPTISRHMPEAMLLGGEQGQMGESKVYLERARNKPIVPKESEREYNIRARSAKMRVAIRNDRDMDHHDPDGDFIIDTRSKEKSKEEK